MARPPPAARRRVGGGGHRAELAVVQAAVVSHRDEGKARRERERRGHAHEHRVAHLEMTCHIKRGWLNHYE